MQKIGFFKSSAWHSMLIIYFKYDSELSPGKNFLDQSRTKKEKELADKPGSVVAQ